MKLIIFITLLLQGAYAPDVCDGSQNCAGVACSNKCPAGDSTTGCNKNQCIDCLAYAAANPSFSTTQDAGTPSFTAGTVSPDVFSNMPSGCGTHTCSIHKADCSAVGTLTTLSGSDETASVDLKKDTVHTETACIKCTNDFGSGTSTISVDVFSCSTKINAPGTALANTVMKIRLATDTNQYFGPESTSMTFPSGSSATAVNFVKSTDTTNCPITPNPTCSLKGSGCASAYAGTDITMSGNVLSVSLKVMSAQTLCVECSTNHGPFQTGDFQISVVCDTSANMFSNTQAASVTQVIKKLGAADVYHEFLATHFATGGATECPATFSMDDSAYTSNVGALTFSDQGSGTYRVTPSNVGLVGVYQFDARAQASGQTDYYKKMYKLTVACGSGSVTITEPDPADLTNGFDVIQEKDVSLSTTYFLMPKFASSVTDCPVTKYEPVDTSGNVISSLTIIQSGTNIQIKPTNTATVQEYTFNVRATMEGPNAALGNEVLTSTQQYKLRVGCGSWETLTQDSSFVVSDTMVAEATYPNNVYTVVPPVMSPSFCVPTLYTIVSESPDKTVDFYNNMNKATCDPTAMDCNEMVINTAKGDVTFDLLITGSTNSMTQVTVTVSIPCTPTIQYTPATLPPVPNIVSPQEQYVSSSVTAQFTYPDFFTDLNTACPIEKVELSTVNTGVTAPTGLSYTFSAYDTTDEIITVTDSTLKQTYTFYMKVTAKGGANLFTNQYTLDVVCNKDSTTISHDATMDLIQYVDTSTDTTYGLNTLSGTVGTFAKADVAFILPAFTSSNTQCPIVASAYDVTSDTAGTTITEPLFDSTSGTSLKIRPENLNVNVVKKYTFYVKSEAEVRSGLTQNIYYSPLLTLYVGCDPSWLSITAPTTFATSFPLHVNDVTTNVYTFDQYTSSLTYCPITSITLINVMADGAADATAVSLTTVDAADPTSCATSNDCRKVIVDTSLKRQITFQLQIETKGGFTLDSAVVTSDVTCGPNSVTITEKVPTLSRTQTQDLTTVAANIKFIFQQYTTSHADCPISSMIISSTYGTVTAHPDLDYTFVSTNVNQIVNPKVPHIKASHIFYIKAIAEGGKEIWQASGTKNTMIIVCGLASTVFATPVVPTAAKFVDVSQPADAFISFPEFTSSQQGECPSVFYKVYNTLGMERTDMIITGTGTNPVVIKPKDDSIDKQYIFKVKAFAVGGATVTTALMTLNIGCGNWNQITQPADFDITVHNIFVNEVDADLYHYEFSDFTIFPTYCDLQGYQPVNVKLDGIAKADRIIFPPVHKCSEKSEDCNVFEVNTELEGLVTFQVQVLNEGNKVFYSSVASYQMTCGPDSVNFTKPQPIYEFLDNEVNTTVKQNKKEKSSTETKFLFAPLNSPAEGCPVVKTEINKIGNDVPATPLSYDKGTFGFNAISGYYEFVPNNLAFVGQYFFYIRFEAKGGKVGWTEELQLNIGCGLWVEIIPASGNFTKLMELKVGDVATYPIAEFQTDTPHCPVENFLITANTPAGTINYPSGACNPAEGTCYLADINTNAEANIKFQITIVAGEGKVFINSEMVTIKVTCGPNIKIIMSKPSKGYSQSVTSNNAEYIFSTFKTSVPSCPVVKISISGKYGSDGAAPGLAYTYSGSSDVQVVKPLNAQLTKNYVFYVKAEAKGGASAWSLVGTPYILEVKAKSKVVVKKAEKKVEVVKEEVKEEVKVEVIKDIYDGNFTAKIKKVDTEGVAHIVFSESMIDEKGGFNISWIDMSSLELTVIPTEGSLFEMEKYKDPVSGKTSMDFHNFTWEPLSFKGDTLLLQLNFKYPLNVSTSSQERDVLELKILNRTLFRTKEGNKILAEQSQVSNRFIARLVLDGSISLDALFSNGDEEDANPLYSFLVNLFVCMTLVNLLDMINSLQIICFQIMLNIINPGNVQLFLQGILQLINADFFDPEYTTKLVFDFDSDEQVIEEIIDEQRDTILIDQIQEIGFETFSPILNMGGLFVIVFLYFFDIFFIVLLMVFLKLLVKVMQLNQLVFTWKKLQAINDYNIDSDSDLEGTQFEGGSKKVELEVIDEKSEENSDSDSESDNEEEIAKVRYKRRNCAPKLKVINPEKYEMVKLKKELYAYNSSHQKLAHLRRHFQIDKVKSNRCCLCCMRWTISRINRTKKQLFFNGAILIVLESICQFAISAYLYWVRPEEEFAENQVTYYGQKITAFFCMLCLVIMIAMSIGMIFVSEETLTQKQVRRKISMLYEFQSLKTYSSKAYTFFFIIRRLNIVIVSFLWQKNSSLQVIAMVIQNQLFMIYAGNFLPLRTPKANKIELVNELSIDFITLHLVLYTNFCHNQYTKYNAGFSMIMMVIMNIFYNLYFPFRELMRQIRLRIKKLLIRIPYWYYNAWDLAIASEYKWLAENAVLLKAAWLGYLAQRPVKETAEKIQIKSKVEIIKENNEGLSFEDMQYFMDEKKLNQEQNQMLTAIFQKMKENEDNVSYLRKKTFFIRRRIYMNSIRILFPRMTLKEIYDQAQELKQLFPSERARIFYEKNTYDFLRHQFETRFMKEKHERYMKTAPSTNFMLAKMTSYQDYYEFNKIEGQKEFVELIFSYFEAPYEDFMRKYSESKIDLTDQTVHDGLCKELTNRFITKELLPRLKPVTLMPHHLFQIIYPIKHIQTFEQRMFDMREVLYNELAEQITKTATVDETNDIFSQVVKDNETKYDSVKWSQKQINELGKMDRALRTKRLNELFDDYRFGATQVQRYERVQNSMRQLYYFLTEYHNAEVAFLEKQEQRVIKSLTIPPSDEIQDKQSEEAEFFFTERLIELIRNTEVGDFTWNTNFLKQEIIN